MALSIYREGSNSRLTGSPLKQSSKFVISYAGTDDERSKDTIPIQQITGIAEEAPVLQYSTSWGGGPTTIFAEKLTEFANNDFIKTFAAKNKRGTYRPIIATDSWTQQYPNDGTKLEVGLKFRSYPTNMYDTTNYFDVIKALIMFTAPRKFKISDSINIALEAMQAGADTGIDLGEALKNINDALKNASSAESIDWKEMIKEVIYNNKDTDDAAFIEGTRTKRTINEISSIARDKYGQNSPQKILATQLGGILNILDTFTKVNGAGGPRFSLHYGNVYKSTDYNYWVIGSWSFKPSINTTIINGMICPIYVDINITLHTSEKLGSNEMSNILK